MLASVRLRYFWKDMTHDIAEFCKGCIMCQIFKTSTTGKSEVGTPRAVLRPNSCWQIDVCSGFPPVKGQTSFLNIVDIYTGYCIPVCLKGETSEDIARAVENFLIKPFGPPLEISADNAANLNGPAMKKLLKFYNISFRQTVPYSPESHSNVEISNRYVTELIRIFSDQFQCTWPNALTMSALVLNSVPRPQLKGHSPHYLMFLTEPLGQNLLAPVNENNLDIDTYVATSLNDRNFIKLVREFLLKQREIQNKGKNRKLQSFPKGTIVYVRDMRPGAHKKFKPVYFKLPQMVVSEYRCTVYTKDFLGRLKKHSKNNLKKASPRSAKLFADLPADIKMILGEEFGPEKWTEYAESGIVPNYLENISFEEDNERVTRGSLPKDSHLLVTPPLEVTEETLPVPEIDTEEDTLPFGEIENSETLAQLRNLHENVALTDTNIRLSDVPILHANLPTIVNQPVEQNFVPTPVPTTATAPIDPAGINVDNILPSGTRRQRNVRFNLPTSN
jgi:hypothetical protein